MTSFNIEFAATCDTKFGERACICGNLPELGAWNPSHGLLLETNPKKYPLWVTRAPIAVPYPSPHPAKLSQSSSNSAS